MNWLWQLAERMDWSDRWPRSLWRAILKWQDRKHGHYLHYDDPRTVDANGEWEGCGIIEQRAVDRVMTMKREANH